MEKNKKLNYHYVVFSYPRDYFKVMFQNAIDEFDVEYISDPIVHGGYGKILQIAYHLHFNPYLNWKYELPFKDKWLKLYYNKTSLKPICFLFLMDWIVPRNRGLIDILKVKYPNAKFVVYLEDLVSRHSFDVEEAKKFDLVISYDKGDAKRYNYVYYPTFMSKINLKRAEKEHSDFCFIGLPKNRLDKIYEVYHYLSSLGYKCDFIISGLKEKKQRISGIKYINHDMNYYDYLQHVVNSDCIVEIMQENAQGFTLRTWEALLYNKKLLTNNADIVNTDFYNPSQIMVFDDIKKISTDSFHKAIFDSLDFMDKISPINLFKLLESKL